MPIYSYSCENCYSKEDILKSIKDFDRDEFCGTCKHKLKKGFSSSIAIEQKGYSYNTEERSTPRKNS